MFCVQPELPQRSANAIGRGSISGGTRPAIAAARVLKLQIAAIGEKQAGLVEGRIDDIPSRFFFGEFSEVHALYGTSLRGVQHLHLGFGIPRAGDVE